MDLSTNYLGFKLNNPFMPGASPLSDNIDRVKRLEDAGAAAIVLHSLFEEQLAAEDAAATRDIDGPANSFAEATSFFPNLDGYRLGPEDYLKQIVKIKQTVGVPIIGSLNGITSGGWLGYAGTIQEAGADALELNVYSVPTDTKVDGLAVEQRIVEMMTNVRKEISIPVVVKLSPFYSSLPHLVKKLVAAGANGVVLFNRFYQPDINIEETEVNQNLELSTSTELLLRLRWLAILSGQVETSLAVTGGVHTVEDTIKSIMAGAHAVQLVSTLYQNGLGHLTKLRDGVARWLEEHEYESLQQAQGSMNLAKCPNPAAFERGNYAKILQGWEAPTL